MNHRLQRLLSVAVASGALVASGSVAVSQSPASRISGEISATSRVSLPGSHSPLARAANSLGHLDGTTPLKGMSLVFTRTAAQAADLEQLVAAQQDPASPLYHKWLTPDQFGAQFGMSDADLSKAQAWLQQQGFAVDSVSRSRDRITFSGTASLAETAFGTTLNRYTVRGETRFSPADDVTLPAVLASVVRNVTNLSSFRPHSHARIKGATLAPSPNFTSNQTSGHFLTPGDVRTIYDINAAYSAGYTGTGQTIAVVGQSAIIATDIEKFQSAAGLTIKDPTLVLVPNSGTSTVYTDDESESDLDLEYAGAIATGATIKFIYTGSSANYSVTDAEAYAISNNLAPIVSISYGECEYELGAADYATQNAIFQQAAAQGQTVIAAAGDDGSSDCASNNITGLYADFPSSSQYVTGMGGTEFPAASVATTNTTYWQAASGSDVIASALSYIPEQAWNDSSTTGLSSGGGGASMYTARPSWQTGVTGIASGAYRLVPDISLAASPVNAAFLYCSSDSDTGVNGSCANGFRDSSNTYLTTAGGTSFDAPIFAGMLAIINQAINSSGQGVVNTKLYALAANSTTYASVFHDITSGTNECPTGYRYCSTAGASSYAATTGYDEATGLGSVDLYKLLTAWSSTGITTSSLLASTTTLTAATTTPASGASDVIAIKVASGSSSSTATPTGTATVIVDGSSTASMVTLTGGTASYTFSSTTAGTHTVAVTYSGDTTFAASTATITLTIPSTTTASSSFTVAATAVTVAAGSSGVSTVTVTPAGGYTGTVNWTVSTTSSSTNACYSIANTAVAGTTAVSTTLTVYTSNSACTSLTPLSQPSGRHAFNISAASASATPVAVRSSRERKGGLELACIALGLVGLGGLRHRRLRPIALMVLMLSAGYGLSGCGGGTATATTTTTTPTTPTTTNAATGTYTLTLTGKDSATTLTASTNLVLTVN